MAKAKDFPGRDFDLIACFDALHDMGDPEGAAAHIRAALKPDGTFMLVEPFAHDDVADNLNPVGRLYYSLYTRKPEVFEMQRIAYADWAKANKP